MAIFIQLNKIIPKWNSNKELREINGKMYKLVDDMLVYYTIAPFYKRGLITISDMKKKPCNMKALKYANKIIKKRINEEKRNIQEIPNMG